MPDRQAHIRTDKLMDTRRHRHANTISQCTGAQRLLYE